MITLELSLNRQDFRLIWISLHTQESRLLDIIDKCGEDSDEAADALNDITYLRLYKKELRQKAEGIFNEGAFIPTDGIKS